MHGSWEMAVCAPREGADQTDGRAGRFDPQGAIACIRVVHRTDGPGASDSIYCKQRARPHRVFHYRSPYVLITVWIDDIDNPRDPGAHRSRGVSRPFKKHGVAPCRCRAANVCAKERGLAQDDVQDAHGCGGPAGTGASACGRSRHAARPGAWRARIWLASSMICASLSAAPKAGMKPMTCAAGSRMPCTMTCNRLSGRSPCSLLLSASGTFRPSNVGPSPSWWQAEQAPSNGRWAGPGSGACAAALATTARARAWVWAAGALALNEARYRASAWMSASGNGASARTTGVVSPIICRSALAIEAHRGVASLANTARYGPRDAPCAALRWLRAAYDI